MLNLRMKIQGISNVPQKRNKLHFFGLHFYRTSLTSQITSFLILKFHGQTKRNMVFDSRKFWTETHSGNLGNLFKLFLFIYFFIPKMIFQVGCEDYIKQHIVSPAWYIVNMIICRDSLLYFSLCILIIIKTVLLGDGSLSSWWTFPLPSNFSFLLDHTNLYFALTYPSDFIHYPLYQPIIS